MEETAKYLIHADITADGVVERSDVVGAVFGQTEGLLGDELDLRELQQSDRLGRIDVEIRSESGVSFGSITIASGLDKVQTAILGAALESIERVGPCHATVEVSGIEDVRSAKRRQVIERAKELLAEFDETALTSETLVEEVRESVRVEDITDYEGVPAGPHVAESDAVIVVEGRADVLTLLRYGIKNAVAVEGTNVPDDVANLTADRTVTAFLDGDRGGELILRELAQVGDIDYVAFAPDGQSVEDLTRGDLMDALRRKVPYEKIEDEGDPAAALAVPDGSTPTAPPAGGGTTDTPDTTGTDTRKADTADAPDAEDTRPDDPDGDSLPVATAGGSEAASAADVEDPDDGTSGGGGAAAGGVTVGDAADPRKADRTDGEAEGERDDGPRKPRTLAGHVEAVVTESSGRTRLLDDGGDVLADVDADDTFDAIERAETVPRHVVIDGDLSQRVLDVAAQRGVEAIVARGTGEFVKQPTGVRIRLAEEF